MDFCISGQEAVDQVKRVYSCGLQYKLIITDFNMPVMDGIKSTTEIRQFLTNKRYITKDD